MRKRLRVSAIVVGLSVAMVALTMPSQSVARIDNAHDQHVLQAFEPDTQARRPMADFDGDRKADLAYWRPSNGTWYILRSSDDVLVTRQWGDPTDVPVAADFDCDGKADIAVWRPGNRVWYIIRSSDNSNQVVQWGTAAEKDFPVIGSWYRKGCANITATDRVDWDTPDAFYLNMWVYGAGHGVVGDLVSWTNSMLGFVAGDYDGDGLTDAGSFDAFSGRWTITSLVTHKDFSVNWGHAGDVPVVGDFDGDRKADITIYRPADQNSFHILRSSDGRTSRTRFTSGTPIVADYDGDGISDLATYDISTAEWYIVWSSNNSLRAGQFGQPGDIPV